MTLLSVNLNKIALLRNSRDTEQPSVMAFARASIDAGAAGITVHPRPDERHIRRQDVYDLSAMLSVEFNIEGNPTESFVDLVLDVKPAQVTLVPDDPAQLTSDHGWDLRRHGEEIAPIIQRFNDAGIRVSLFMDADATVIPLARDMGADRIELYTEPYARAFEQGDTALELVKFSEAANAAQKCGMGVNAGHDLTLANLGEFCRNVPGVLEVSIGHGLVIDALLRGWDDTIRAYVDVLAQAARPGG
jgi:pyridoxine 5-phosphate synthase